MKPITMRVSPRRGDVSGNRCWISTKGQGGELIPVSHFSENSTSIAFALAYAPKSPPPMLQQSE
jgi:hypothetical protein